MTAQMHDSIRLNDQKFSIVGVHGNELFNPANYNLHPFSTVTSCWRGYVCAYHVVLNKLILSTLQINLESPAPPIEHRAPASTRGMFNHTYRDLHLPVDFTGEILAGDRFLRELYVHMGFHPAWKYQTVYELSISHGAVIRSDDVSQQMAELRKQMTGKPPQFLEK